MEPRGLLAYLIIGLIAGWLAGKSQRAVVLGF